MAFKLVQACRRADVEVIVAPYEADAQLAHLALTGAVHAVITEDSDLLTFGCARVLYKMDEYGNAREVRMDRIFRGAALAKNINFGTWTLAQFQTLCVLAGCDYLPSLPGLGLKTAYKLVKSHGTIARILPLLQVRHGPLPDGYAQMFERALLTFRHQRVWNADSGTASYLTPLPSDIDERDTHFVGPAISPSRAAGIACGDLNPHTGESFITQGSTIAAGDIETAATAAAEETGTGSGTGSGAGVGAGAGASAMVSAAAKAGVDSSAGSEALNSSDSNGAGPRKRKSSTAKYLAQFVSPDLPQTNTLDAHLVRQKKRHAPVKAADSASNTSCNSSSPDKMVSAYHTNVSGKAQAGFAAPRANTMMGNSIEGGGDGGGASSLGSASKGPLRQSYYAAGFGKCNAAHFLRRGTMAPATTAATACLGTSGYFPSSEPSPNITMPASVSVPDLSRFENRRPLATSPAPLSLSPSPSSSSSALFVGNSSSSSTTMLRVSPQRQQQQQQQQKANKKKRVSLPLRSTLAPPTPLEELSSRFGFARRA